MNYGLPEKDIQLITEEIKKNLGTTQEPKLFIYGSRVKGGYRPYSDIDLLLTAKLFDEGSLNSCDFESLDTPYKVDFVLDKNLYHEYQEEIYSHMLEVEM